MWPPFIVRKKRLHRNALDDFVNYMSHMIHWNDIDWQRGGPRYTLQKYDDMSKRIAPFSVIVVYGDSILPENERFSSIFV
ncbi:hypothetical protein GT50_13450 [Geobacillus stearothermophilus 10]|nr:hypothetical protein GT50_13450 [Geobacillus stearothermophilus 10]